MTLKLFEDIGNYVKTEIVDKIDRSGDARLTFLPITLGTNLPPRAQIHNSNNENYVTGGGGGSVYKSKWAFPLKWTETRLDATVLIDVAVKIIHNDNISNDEFKREAYLWMRVPPHPNVLPLVGIYMQDGVRGLVSPLAPSVLSASLKGEITDRERFKLVCDVAEGLKHLHENDVIHGDLSLGNTFVVEKTAVLSDFGLSRLEAERAARDGEVADPQLRRRLDLISKEARKIVEYDITTSKKKDVGGFGYLAESIMTGVAGHGLVELLNKCKSNDADRPADGKEIVERIRNLADFVNMI